MSDWLARISTGDLFVEIAHALSYFEDYHDNLASRLNAKDQKIINVGAEIPDLTLKIHDSWVQIKAIFEFVELRRSVKLAESRKFYLETYKRSLTSAQVEKYAEAVPDVIAFSSTLITIGLIGNRFEGLSKALERLHHQVRIIADLRKAGLDDATI